MNQKRDKQKRRKRIPFYGLLIAFALCISCNRHTKQADENEVEKDTIRGTYQYGICIDSLEVTEYLIKNGENPASILARLGFSPAMADSINRASGEILDPTRIRAGMSYYTFCTRDSLPEIKYIAFAKNLTDFAIIDLTKEHVTAYPFNKLVTTRRRYLEATLSSSLWNEIKGMGADPLLAIKLSDVFAWQIDFFDVKEGDSFQVIYHEEFIEDSIPLNISSVEGAIFNHIGKRYIAIPFVQDSVTEFFDEEGNSLRKAFLKAPMDFFRITSRFTNSRFHPVLKRYRAHHGVDYAAPVGTPVKTIGDGTVIAKGYQGGGAGNFLKIQHNTAYATTYMHLSRFKKGLRIGSRVQQGEVVGYVGSTGLSTGPHLDFRVYKHGKAINPLHMEAPLSKPVSPELMDSFRIVKQRVLLELDSLSKNKEHF